jgi:hypothetical protein
MLDVDRADANVRARDSVHAGQRREYGANAMLTSHSLDADASDHTEN